MFLCSFCISLLYHFYNLSGNFVFLIDAQYEKGLKRDSQTISLVDFGRPITSLNSLSK